MIDIVITLIFSAAMLMFMVYPAMKIVEFIATKKELTKKTEDFLTIIITLSLSLMIGLFLKKF
jgi:Na+-driven multidrug efflux pump